MANAVHLIAYRYNNREDHEFQRWVADRTPLRVVGFVHFKEEEAAVLDISAAARLPEKLQPRAGEMYLLPADEYVLCPGSACLLCLEPDAAG